MARSILWFIFLAVLLEFFFRLAFGLGEPPLYVYDEKVEYYFKPEQELVRFGNSFSTNAFGMRSSDINVKADDVILLVGDSVVSGGVSLDQGQIIATRLEEKIQYYLDNSEVKVASVSAGSWGPRNQINFLDRLPNLSVIAVVHIFSSHDDGDIPTFQYNPILQPEKNPVLALEEVMSKYLPRVVGLAKDFIHKDKPDVNASSPTASGELAKIISYLESYQVPVLHYHHLTRSEILGERMTFKCEEKLQCRAFEHQTKDARSLDLYYIDDIHPSAIGADRMASRAMLDLEAIL